MSDLPLLVGSGSFSTARTGRFLFSDEWIFSVVFFYDIFNQPQIQKSLFSMARRGVLWGAGGALFVAAVAVACMVTYAGIEQSPTFAVGTAAAVLLTVPFFFLSPPALSS